MIQETTPRRVSFYLRAPREGNYYLTVFAQQVQERLRLENIYKAVCEYKVCFILILLAFPSWGHCWASFNHLMHQI